MPQPQLLIGSTLRSIRHELLQRGANQNSLVLVPGFAAVRGWRKVAQKYFPDGCALPHFAVINDWFIEAALASANKPLRFIHSSQRKLVLRSLLTELNSQNAFQDLQKLAESNQFLNQIDSWMAHLFEANIAFWPDNGGPWSRDLQLILQKYFSWKQRQRSEGLWDAEFAPRLFAESISNYPALPREIILEGAVTLSPNLQAGFKSLSAACDHFTVTLVAPGIGAHCTSWEELLDFCKGSLLENCLQFWQSQNADFEIIEEENPIYTDRLIDLAGLANSRLERHQTAISSAHTARHELREIATSIREKSIDIHDAAKRAIVLNNTSRYADVLKSTFTEYGLPLRRFPGQSLSLSPLAGKWMQLLNLPRQQWKVSALADVFSGGTLTFVIDGHVLDARNIEKAAAQLRQYSLSDLEEFSRLLKSTFIRDLDADEIAKDINVLEQLQTRLSQISEAETLQKWLQLVMLLWRDVTAHWEEEKSEIAEIAQRQISDVEFALRSLKQVTASWQKYFPEDARLWQSQLSLALSDAKSSGEVGIRSGVDAVHPRQLVQDVPEILYWPGMLEADYPLVSKDALQSRHQKMMQELCPHLPSPTAQSIYWLALALAGAQEIYFSWPKFCDDSPMLQSVLLEEITEKKVTSSDSLKETFPERSRRDDTSAPLSDRAVKKYFSQSQWRQDAAIAFRKNRDISAIADQQLPSAVLAMFVMRNEIPLNIFDGSLGDDGEELVKRIQQKKGHPLSLSASSLQSYAECGLKYFFQKVLSLKDRPDKKLLLQKDEAGSLIHSILENFYTQFPHLLDAAHQNAAWELLVKLTRQEVARLPISEVLQKVEIRRLIGDGKDAPRGTLGKYLLSEVELRQNWDASDFAQQMQPFGLSSLSLPDELQRAYEGTFNLKMNDIHLDGKFDRLDVSADGRAVMAVDYKTGKVPPVITAPDGVSFQLPLYLWALDQIFDKQQLDIGGVFYSLTEFKYQAGISQPGVLKANLKKDGTPKKPANNSPRSLDQDEWNSFMEKLSGQIKTIHYLIEHGHFPISVRDAADAKCEYCDFKNICFRNEEMQMERQLALTGEEPIYTSGLTTRIEWGSKEVKK